MHGTLPLCLGLTSLFLLSLQEAGARLWITEIMAENGSTLRDGRGEASDWIEIYNAGEEAVNLKGYGLNDDAGVESAWYFPEGILEGGEFLLVFATENVENGGRDQQGHFYAPFQLKAKGESVQLIGPDGTTVVHEMTFPSQGVDCSFGLVRAGGWGRDATALGKAAPLKWPTPGEANAPAVEGAVRSVFLSEDHGFFEAPFVLSMETTTPGAMIRYTLDGSAPLAYTGFEYTEPIRITRTHIVRARAFREGYRPSPVSTATYLFLEDVIRQSPRGEPPQGWPNGWVNRQVLDYGMDPDIVGGEHTPEEVAASLRSLPSLSVVTSIENLFHPNLGIYANPRRKGLAWERPASLELLHPEGGRTFQIDGGLRMRGAWSRRPENPKHAMRFVFRKAYGAGKLKFPLFGDEGAKEFDHIDLRTSLNYAWVQRASSRNTLLRDIFCRDTQRDMGQPYTRSRYYHLYLNGHYWGVYMTQERAVAPFAASYLGGAPEDYDVVKSRGELAEGTWEAHRAFYELALEGFHDDVAYWRAQGMNPDGSRNPEFPRYLDVDNVIDYMLLTYYSANQDGPGGRFTEFPNNFYAIYNRERPDGWKFFAHDMEHTFDVGGLEVELQYRRMHWRYFNVHWLHEQLIENKRYLRRFTERVNEHFFDGGALTTEKALARLQEREGQIRQAMIAHAARWGDAGNGREHRPYTRRTWQSAVDRLREYIRGRREGLLEDFVRIGWYRQVAPPEWVERDGQWFLAAEEGEVFYTLDGSDPRGEDGSPALGARRADLAVLESEVLVDGRSRMKAWAAVNGAHDRTWRDVDFDDAAWREGPARLGYDDDGDYFDLGLIGFDIAESMRGKTTSVYMRVPFEISGGPPFAHVDLEMKCDDGFAAFLDGIPAAAVGAPSRLTWRSASTVKPRDGEAVRFQRFRVSADAAKVLGGGKHVLAIHGLNVDLPSSDLLMIPRLIGHRVLGGAPLPTGQRIRARAVADGRWSTPVDRF